MWFLFWGGGGWGGWWCSRPEKHPSGKSKCVPAAAPAVSAVETIFRAS